MTDGTEALNAPATAQPATDAVVASGEQAEGASETTGTSADTTGWTAPEGFDEHLGKALSKIPAEQREVFLALEPDGLNNVRDLVLKGVDYTQKRQKESGELRDIQAKMAALEADAAAWAEAKADPIRASKMFQAYAGGEVDGAPAKESSVEFNDIWDATDPDVAKQTADKWQKQLREQVVREVLDAQRNSPEARQATAQQTINSIRTGDAAGLDDAGWGRALESVQGTLNRQNVDYRSLSPEQLRLVISPAVDYELRAASTNVKGLNPTGLSGNQAASIRGSGAPAAKPIYKQPSADASIEEKMAWFKKTQGMTSDEQLFGK